MVSDINVGNKLIASKNKKKNTYRKSRFVIAYSI